ncbi:MAG: hypothetical protein BGO95_04615 [Micrococcales bacterium 73-13]|nr:MAG: hypothetical protein BGO95_04615 [Micrococcales bacterium 73-13]
MTASADSPPARPSALAAVLYAIAATGLGGLPIWMLSAFAPAIQADLGFDDTHLGIVIALYFGLSAVTGLPLGRLMQRLGWRAGIAFSTAVVGLCLVLIAVMAQSWVLLAISLCVGAVSNNSSQPASNLALSLAVPQGRQGLAFGLKQAALPISTFLVGLSVPLFGQGGMWREAFLVAAALSLAMAVGVIARSALAGARVLSSRRRRPSVEARTGPRARTPHAPPARSLILLSIGAGFGTAATVSFGSFLVVFAVSEGFSASAAATMLALGSLVGIASRVLFGYIADRRGRRHLVTVAYMMGSGCIGFLVLALLGGSQWGLLLGTLLAYGLGWAWNGLFHFAIVRYSTIPPAVTTSIAQIAMSIGAAVGPAVFGLVSALSFTASWYLGATMFAAAGALILLGRRALNNGR